MPPSNHGWSPLYLGAGFLFLTAVALWEPLKTQDVVARRAWLRSFLNSSPAVYWSLLGTGIGCLIKGISHVKIGITRTLGLPVASNHAPEEPSNGTGRRLGLLERWYTAHSRRGNHTGITLGVEFESPCPNLDDLRAILHRVSLRFPMLRARIFRDGVDGMDATDRLKPAATKSRRRYARNRTTQRLWGDDLYLWISHETDRQYVRLEDWQMERDDGEGEGNGLRAVLEEQNARAWHDEDPSLPLWKVTLIRWKECESTFALVLSFHHAITDGIGATAVVQAIVDESARQQDPPSDEEILCKDVPPPLEDILDTVPRVCHIWRPLLLDLFPFLGVFLSPRSFSGRPKKHVTTHFADHMGCFELANHDGLKAFQETCRAREVTMHAALVATLCKAIAIHVDQVQTVTRDFSWSKGRLWNGNIRFRINNPVNERNHCKPPSEPSDLGCRISTTDLVIQAGPYSDLRLLEKCYANLLRRHRDESPMIVGLSAFISQDWLQFSSKRVRLNRGDAVDSIDASNLGCVDIKTASPEAWKVQSLWLVHGRQNPAPALKACWVTTKGGSMNLVLSSLPQHFSRDDLLSIGSLCQVLLRMEYVNQLKV